MRGLRWGRQVLSKGLLNWSAGKRDMVVGMGCKWKLALYSDERPCVC